MERTGELRGNFLLPVHRQRDAFKLGRVEKFEVRRFGIGVPGHEHVLVPPFAFEGIGEDAGDVTRCLPFGHADHIRDAE